MRQPRPSWLYPLLLAAVVCSAAAEAANTVGTPGAEKPAELVMNEFPVLPPDARKKFDITAHDPTSVAELGVVDFFQLVADILKMNIVIGDRAKLEPRRVGIVIRDMTIEEAIRLVLQMNDLKAVHFNDNTIIVMDRTSRADFGVKQPRRFRLRYTTVDKVREFVTLNAAIGRQLGTNVTFDATTNSIIAIDNPENLRLIEDVLGQIDVPPMKILEAVKLSYIDLTRFSTLARTLGQDIVARLATIGLSYNQDARALMVYGTPEDVALIRNLAEKFDVAPKQVLIDTAFLQVSESFNREFGFKFTNNSITVNQFDRIFNVSRIRESTAGPPPVFPTRTQINYLISKTGAKTLQSPKVRALDNTPATINVGEIRNIQIQSTATTLGTGVTPGQQQTTFNTQEVPIGVQVNVTPQIHNDDSVTLDMRISVTKVLEIKSFGVDRTTQDSTTKLRIRNGETVVLGGFINQVLNSDDTPIPVIGEVPLLDKIFRNKKRERTDSELVFLLTPYILDFQDASPNKAPCEQPLPIKTTVSTRETVTTTTTTTVESTDKLGDTGPSEADRRAVNKGGQAALSAVPAKIEVRTTHVLEDKSGKPIQPRKGWTENPTDPRVLEVSKAPRGKAAVDPASVYEAAGSEDEAPSRPIVAAKPKALSETDSQQLRRIASLARARRAPARGRLEPAAASPPSARSERASISDRPQADRPDRLEPKIVATLEESPPLKRRGTRNEKRAGAARTEDSLERLNRLARARENQRRYRAVTDESYSAATKRSKSHEMLAELRAERQAIEAASATAAPKAKPARVVAAAASEPQAAPSAESHPELRKLREERLAEEAKEEVAQPKKAAPAAAPRAARMTRRAAPVGRPAPQSDSELIARLKSMTGQPPAARPPARARPAAVRANAAAHDRALIARLEQLSEPRPAPRPVPQTVVYPGGPKLKSEEPRELPGGTGFDELARSLEADLGRM